jgi:hypothetical protein
MTRIIAGKKMVHFNPRRPRHPRSIDTFLP